MKIIILTTNNTALAYELEENISIKDIMEELEVNEYIGLQTKDGVEIIINLDKTVAIEFHKDKE
jgi:hypothetical protein|nr:MAG TPA: hypothetical protein [Caudoviricetes sp.]